MRRTLALLSLVAVSSAAEPATDTPTRIEAAGKVRLIIAHRGSSIDRPENTLAALRRAIEVQATASEIDVRTSRDGVLVCLHDADLARTTDGTGKVSERTLAELKRLDAGGRFDPKFRGERIPELSEVLAAARGKIDVLLDLKEDGIVYLERIAAVLRRHGEPRRAILGVRTVEQARRLRKLLPETRQIGLIPTPGDLEAFAAAGVTTIRLWPRWLDDRALVPRLRKLRVGLLLGVAKGTPAEVLPLLAHQPEALFADDPARLKQTLQELIHAGRKR